MTANPYATSTVKKFVDRAAGGMGNLSELVRRSLLGRTVARTASVARHSALYRWLTAEPDSDIVVIDLRDTWTVGPILVVLDWLLAVAARFWEPSIARTSAQSFARAFRESPIRTVGLVLLLAVVGNTIVTGTVGSLGTRGLGLRCVLAAIAMAATRVRTPLDELAESWIARVLRAILEPPEPPEEK